MIKPVIIAKVHFGFVNIYEAVSISVRRELTNLCCLNHVNDLPRNS